jgi:glyoxylase-like metal-dependent hydrolase (beta-lactamase superfamily II)
VERVLTRGELILDGRRFRVDNNVWLVGDDSEVLVIDAAHDPAVIAAAVGGRRVSGIIATHGHSDHINAAVELADLVGAPLAMHRADQEMWSTLYPDRRPDRALVDGAQIPVPGGVLHVLHTPGHTAGGVSLFGTFADGPRLFSGDTLFRGGPGVTGASCSDTPTILASVRGRLLALPPQTVVYPGHGDDTTIGAEAAGHEAWPTA